MECTTLGRLLDLSTSLSYFSFKNLNLFLVFCFKLHFTEVGDVPMPCTHMEVKGQLADHPVRPAQAVRHSGEGVLKLTSAILQT